MTVLHRNLTGAELHEPKGVSTANDGEVYVANGGGSGSWQEIETVDPEDIAIPVGTVGYYGGNEAPPGWFLCYGQEVSRATYSDLYSILGDVFGAGNGTTTFNVPDCRGRTIESKANDTNLGDTTGFQNHQITTNQTPALSGTTNTTGAHTHAITPTTDWIAAGSAWDSVGGSAATFPSFGSAGNHSHNLTMNAETQHLPHNNMQPSIVLNTIIYHGVL